MKASYSSRALMTESIEVMTRFSLYTWPSCWAAQADGVDVVLLGKAVRLARAGQDDGDAAVKAFFFVGNVDGIIAKARRNMPSPNCSTLTGWDERV